MPAKAVIDLLIEAACQLRDEFIDEIEFEEPSIQPETGVSVFDGLDPKTRIFAIVHVLKHLSDPALPSPDLFAWNEGALWALFKKVEMEITCEIDREGSPEQTGTRYRYRRLVLDALASYGQPVKQHAQRSRNLRLWRDRLEMIYNNFFWDMDCLDDGVFGDIDPKRAEVIKAELGIDTDYYSTPPPLVRDEEFLEADAYIQRVGGYGGTTSG